ncbi:MAG: aminotransferase class V-fold PLP-dependent enzyme [Acidobacteria bacterium]|nr:aminotransferase class V-fold PLP-dependent enzyme [Acidobacteriota bacterium]
MLLNKAMTPTRRTFFHTLAGAAALPRFASALAASTGDDGYWQAVRRQFAFAEDKVPMNAANLCPSPRAVGERVAELTRDIDADCSFQNRAKFAQLTEDARAKVAEMMGVSADEIALVRNTSESNNIINNGLPLAAGDEVVIWEQNHPTNNVAWDVRARRFGIVVKRVKTPADPQSVDDLIEPFRKALGPKTKVLSLTHASNTTGVKLPVQQLIEIGHAKGLHVHVDGAQSWGALHVNLRELGCDSYSASGHKWFVGPKEVGLLYVKASKIDKIWPVEVAPGWGDTADTVLVGARKLESMGQRDDAALAGVGATADFHKTTGGARIEQHMVSLAQRLKEGLAEAGVKLTTPMKPELSAGVCIMEVPAANRQALMDGLYLEHGIAGSTAGGLRLCPHMYNTTEHVDRAVAGVKALRKYWS